MYLFTPSARNLDRGEIKFIQRLAWSSVSMGVLPFLSIEAGSSIPFWFAMQGRGMNVLLACKAGGELVPNVHLAGGIKSVIYPALRTTMNLPFGALTLGDRDRHVTLAGSVPLFTMESYRDFGEAYWASLSGSLRLSNKTALLSETWALIESPYTVWSSKLISSLAIRILGKKMATDLGMFVYPDYNFPVFPWIGFTFHLRRGRQS